MPSGARSRVPRWLATASSESPSISSSALGTTRAWTRLATASTAWRTVANVARSVTCVGGSGTSLTMTLVITASVPSDPTSSCVRSYPTTFLTLLPPVLITSPDGSTASSPST